MRRCRTLGNAVRTPDAYGADGSITPISSAARTAPGCSADQSFDAAAGTARATPSRPPARPATGAVDGVGQPRVRPPPVDAVEDPPDRSEPSLIDPQHSGRVGSASDSHLAAGATRALCAVGHDHDTPYSKAMSATDPLLEAIADAVLSRSRSVSRPEAGRSLTRLNGRSFSWCRSPDGRRQHPHSGHAPSSRLLID